MDVVPFKALGDENRLAIVSLLAGGERCLCDVSEALGISDALASHHVKRLAEAGIVRTHRRGLWLHCSLACDALDALGEGLRDLGARAANAQRAGACCDGAASARDAEVGSRG